MNFITHLLSPIVPHEKHLLPLLGFDPQTIQSIVKSSVN